MNKWNMKKWFSDISDGTFVRALPIMSYPGLALTGKRVIDAVTDADAQFNCMESLALRYTKAAAAVSFMDLSVEAEAFGGQTRFSDDEVPVITGRIVEDTESARKLRIPEVGSGRTSVCIRTMEKASMGISDRPVLGGQIGPFSLAGRLMDMTEIMIAIMEEEEMVHIVLEKCTHFLTAYAKALKAAGANGIIMAEPAAGLLPPGKCQEFSSDYIRQIVCAVQDEHFAVILHNCGRTDRLVHSMLSTGAMGLHFGNAVNMAEILPQIPENIIAFGNIDPAGLFRNGTRERMRSEVAALLEAMKPYKNYVISSGCDIPPASPLENLDAFFAGVDAFNGKGREA